MTIPHFRDYPTPEEANNDNSYRDEKRLFY